MRLVSQLNLVDSLSSVVKVLYKKGDPWDDKQIKHGLMGDESSVGWV